MSRGMDSPFELIITFTLVRHTCIDSAGDCSIVTFFNAKLLIKCVFLVAEKIQNKQTHFLITRNMEISHVVQTVKGECYLNLARSRLKYRSVNIGPNIAVLIFMTAEQAFFDVSKVSMKLWRG